MIFEAAFAYGAVFSFPTWLMVEEILLTKTATTFVDLDADAMKFYQLPASSPDIVAGLLGLWLLTDHGISQQNGHGYKMDSKKAGAFVSLRPPDRIAVTTPFEAFAPIERAETWFQVLPVPSKDEYLAVAQFRHTPYDVVIVRARRNSRGDWRIVRFWWEITH